MLLPDPDAPVIATSMPSGNVTSIDFRLFSRAPRTTSALPLPLPPLRRRRDRALAREELPGRRRLAREHVVERALHDDACRRARPGPGPISTR